MRIAYVATSLGRGGAERQVIAVAERMAAQGQQVVLLVLKSDEANDWPTSVPVMRLNMKKSIISICSGLRQANLLLREFEPDIVHCHTFPANMASRALHLLGSAPVVLTTIHNVYEGGLQRTTLYRLTDSLSAHTTAVSEAVAKRQIEAGTVSKAKCSVITNGIDCALFKPSPLRRMHTRTSLRAVDRFIWLAAGRLAPAKDYPNLLRSFALVCAACPDTELWIAGEGSAAYKKKLQKLAQTFGITGSIRWLGLRDDMPALLDAADAFVLSSAWEGMPLAIGEAMAMQKPVVATDVGGVRELTGDSGVVVPPQDSQTLSDAMLWITRMPSDGLQKRGREARDRIRRGFGIDAKATEWQALYNTLLQKYATPTQASTRIRPAVSDKGQEI